MTKADIEEIWESFSFTVDDDLFSLQEVAGYSVMKKEEFLEAADTLLKLFKSKIALGKEDLSKSFTHTRSSPSTIAPRKRVKSDIAHVKATTTKTEEDEPVYVKAILNENGDLVATISFDSKKLEDLIIRKKIKGLLNE